MPERVTPRGQAATPVEPNVGPAIPLKPAPLKQPLTIPDEQEGVTYIRNIRGIQCRFTLKDGKGRRVQLEAKGRRGDIDIVSDEDRKDPIYILNNGLLFQEVPASYAHKVISQQQTNATKEEHPIWSQIRNEKGQLYEQRHSTVEDSLDARAITVASINQSEDGRHVRSMSRVDGALGPAVVEVPGSAGHPATQVMNSVPGDILPEDYHEFILWKQYKDAINSESAEQIRDSLNVTVEPVEKEDEPKTVTISVEEYEKFLAAQEAINAKPAPKPRQRRTSTATAKTAAKKTQSS